MRKLRLSFLSAVLVGTLWACAKDAADPSAKKYDENDAEIKTYASQNNLAGTLANSGLYYVITQPNPTGKQATVGEELEFSYKLTNLEGQLIDSSATNTPYYYPLGIGSLFPGLEQGLGLMREGEKAVLLVPSYLAYNDQTLTNLPAYSVVRFDVALSSSRSESQQISEYIGRNKLIVTDSTATGLRFIRTVTNATGTVPTTGQTLTIKYLGKQLRSATAFDSTGTGTTDYVIGRNSVNKGFDEGLSKLKVGEKATILFPSSLGYGTKGVVQGNRYVITPYAPLRFDLELVSAK